ncbi:cytochrome c oxidase subunit 2 [Richelia sinica FACHB-800]|uniref:Cytochrome c oxidase subunit 2 n=1 Tax=Richelia sinica FACHB-800 TaxID=1357546 RepID=A0A975Y6N1_9NOST|nr:cytochrome c oxidase subunit II [Richelia sinica]MBD2666986.1 cytochrome c oxidase subunit II [Richelia sinica FACHB-800]QXE25452.1 cytochrome c oxidase subunit 2 [Richelia sinica FACHB-800]
MSKFLEYLLIAGFIAVLLVVSHWIGQQAYAWMPIEATEEAQKVDALFSFLVSIGAFIILGLVGMMLFSILFFRAPANDYSEGHPSRGDIKLEILWTAAPTVLVLWLAFQGLNIYQQLNILGLQQIVHLLTPWESQPAYAVSAVSIDEPPKPAAETVDVFVKQWDWSFRYANNVISPELHLPVNFRTRLNLHAQDVLHSFYVPDFRLQQYVVPGRDIEIVVTPIRIGKYTLKDALFSGTYFALMDANVQVESLEQYHQWLAQAEQEPPTIQNQAIAEYNQPPKTLFKSGWYTIAPNQEVIARQRKVTNDT